jgi:glyoxylase I family protein
LPVRGLDHYNLRASRDLLDRIRDWYRDVVGLEVGERPPFRFHGYWLYAGGRPILHLSEASPGEAHPVPGSGTFDHVAFGCTEFLATRERLDSLRIPYRVADVPLTGVRQVFLEDPAGNGVELNFDARAEG